MPPKREISEAAPVREPKRRVTRSSARTSTAPAHNVLHTVSDSPKGKTLASKNPPMPERKDSPPTNATSEVVEPPPASDGSPAPQLITTRTITHDLVKKPIQCHQYQPSPSTPSSPLIFTHGAGGTLSADAVVNFCTGFSESLPVLAFQGSMNLKARTKGFHACIEEIYPSYCTAPKGEAGEQVKQKRLLLGGRSMGARAAVIAASEVLADQNHEEEDMSIELILISYPLQGPKDDVRDQILLDLPESVNVLFIIGDKDAMCPLDLLNETRSKMAAKSQIVVVRNADHGMNIKPAAATREVGESTGRVAARWVEGDLKGDVQYIGKEEG